MTKQHQNSGWPDKTKPDPRDCTAKALERASLEFSRMSDIATDITMRHIYRDVASKIQNRADKYRIFQHAQKL